MTLLLIALAFWVGGAIGALAAWLAEDGNTAWLVDDPWVLGAAALCWPWAVFMGARNIWRYVARRQRTSSEDTK